jgi:hypothetical protein
MNRYVHRRPRNARSVWSASGLPALWHVRKSGSKLAALQTLARSYTASSVHGPNSRQHFGGVRFP